MDKIPKIAHFYWDGSPLSFLHFKTIETFNKHNPNWLINLYVPKIKHEGQSWLTEEQKIRYTGRDYFNHLKQWLRNKKMNIIKIDFKSIGFRNDVSEVYKSDYIRWYVLHEKGGLWSDMDIFYIKPLTEIKLPNDLDYTFCYNINHHIIGFYLSKPKNTLFETLKNMALSKLNEKEYQSIGSHLFKEVMPNLENNPYKYKYKSVNLDPDIFYSYRLNMDDLFNTENIENIKENTVGIHWYNGNSTAKIFLNEHSKKGFKNKNVILNLLNENI